MTDRISKTEVFLRKKLGEENIYYTGHPEARSYRLEHTFRVARIGAAIARAEGMDEEAMTIACLLHDVSYCYPLLDRESWQEHGRLAARLARPFLESLGLEAAVIRDICYGIAIHVDDKADCEGERTPFALTVGDADNIDRFDVYRLYETLESVKFSKLSLAEKREHVGKTRERLASFLEMSFATPSATALWRERISYYLDFYRRLEDQLGASAGLAAHGLEDGPASASGGNHSLLLGLSGRFSEKEKGV